MTRMFRASLGFSQLSGKQVIDQIRRFKQQLRSLSPQLDTVALLTVTHADPRHVEVVAMYDTDNPVACSWVRRGERVCTEQWQKLAERRKAVPGQMPGQPPRITRRIPACPRF